MGLIVSCWKVPRFPFVHSSEEGAPSGPLHGDTMSHRCWKCGLFMELIQSEVYPGRVFCNRVRYWRCSRCGQIDRETLKYLRRPK